jgi:dCTP deaminase
MILSDRETQLALRRGQVLITPVPAEEAWSSTAVDLRLGAQLPIWTPPKHDPASGLPRPKFSPAAERFNIREVLASNTTAVLLTADAHFDIEPGQFILGWTHEKLRLPPESRVCARVEGKSSLARLGLGVHVTAPTIHAGFGMGNDPEGDQIQLEIWNVGPLPIELRLGMRVCQLIFEEVHGTPLKGYRGQFLNQGPKLS